MQIALLGDYPLDDTQIRGGVQAAAVYLLKGLARIPDLTLHVLTFRPKNWTGPDTVARDNVTFHLLPPFPRFERARNYRTYQTTLNTCLATLQPQALHAQEATVHAYVALRSGYPAIITAHGIQREDGHYYTDWGRRLRAYFDSRLIERYVMRHTRRLIAISHYLTDYFAAQLHPEARIYYIPNAVDESFFNLTRPPTGHTLLFAGRVIPIKRVLELVEAFAAIAPRLPDAQLRLAGEHHSEPQYVAQVRACIQAHGLEQRVHLLGQRPEPAVLQEFEACDGLVLASAQENLPMVIAQAMAAGKPVVAPRIGGIPELVTAEQTGLLFDGADLPALAAALERLLHDAALRARLGQAGRAFALAHLHLAVVAQRTYAVYQEVALAGKERRHA